MEGLSQHHRNLEDMYLKAPVQVLYPGITIHVESNKATIRLPVSEKFFHAGMAVHGSVYFRLLDDAAYFSVLSEITDFFVLTTSFHIELLRPVNEGSLIATGEVINRSKSLFLASSVLKDQKGRTVALGKGNFMKSELSLNQINTYGKIG